MLEKFLTTTEFAKKTGLTRQRVHVLMREGRIPFEKIGGRYFIPKGAKIRPPHEAAEAGG